MEVLKLDARHPECHGLARALVGSPTITKFPTLFGVLENCFVTKYEARGGANFDHYVTLTLPLDTLKLCPYVCMREGVKLCGPATKDLITDAINEEWTVGQLLTAFDNFGDYIALDLDNLPKGAEIMEGGA